jgi:Fe-S-cluster-containing hydrogenase component 2
LIEELLPVHIEWDKIRCSNCTLCTTVCSERHVGASTPTRAHVRILVDVVSGDYRAEYCRQCMDAPCAAACPVEAIWFDEAVRAWRVNDELCIGCGECVGACPYAAMIVDPVTGLAAKCDLCLGAVHCVEICPTNALSIVE